MSVGNIRTLKRCGSDGTRSQSTFKKMRLKMRLRRLAQVPVQHRAALCGGAAEVHDDALRLLDKLEELLRPAFAAAQRPTSPLSKKI